MLLNNDMLILPLERVIHSIMTAMIVVEAILGFVAIRTMVNAQMVKFHMQQFVDLDDVDEDQFNNMYTQNNFRAD